MSAIRGCTGLRFKHFHGVMRDSSPARRGAPG
jgi:hypothetical protein